MSDTKDDGNMRSFDTGATRDTNDSKLDYDGFLSPSVLLQYAKFMNMNRLQSDGKLRDSDNWQKGIPMDVYRKSECRHHVEFWEHARNLEYLDRDGNVNLIAAACGLLFNVMGFMHEWLKDNDTVEFDTTEPTPEMKERQDRVAEATDEPTSLEQPINRDDLVFLCETFGLDPDKYVISEAERDALRDDLSPGPDVPLHNCECTCGTVITNPDFNSYTLTPKEAAPAMEEETIVEPPTSDPVISDGKNCKGCMYEKNQYSSIPCKWCTVNLSSTISIRSYWRA